MLLVYLDKPSNSVDRGIHSTGRIINKRRQKSVSVGKSIHCNPIVKLESSHMKARMKNILLLVNIVS